MLSDRKSPSSPFLDAFLEASPHQLTAGHLSTELREAIARWFSARGDTMQSSQVILFALADLAAEQIAANPTRPTQEQAINRFIDDVIHGCNAANRRRMGGIPVTIVKQ
jgi:hypothetical protein